MSSYNFRVLFYSEDHRKKFIEENPEILSKTKFFDRKHLLMRTGLDDVVDPNIYLLSLFNRRTLNSVQKTLKPYVIYCECDNIDLRVRHGRNRKNVKKIQAYDKDPEDPVKKSHSKGYALKFEEQAKEEEEEFRERYTTTLKKEVKEES